MLKKYGVFGFLQLIYFKIRTKLLFRDARIIRFPFRIRGNNLVAVGSGFTTGFNCRIDAFDISNRNEILITIGKDVQINDHVHIGSVERVIIQDNVLIASNVFITDHNHGNYSGDFQDSPMIEPTKRLLHSKPVKICRNVWIGEFVSVLPGVTIGEGAIIGTMSVVNKDIPPFSIAVGAPARVVKKFDFESNKWISIKNG